MTNQQYQDAVDWLFVQAPNYQINGRKAYKPGLDNIRKLCEFFGNPQDKLRMIHIGGTNGKGSVSNMLASVLQKSGYKVGLYNSPHLVDFTERIKVNGQNADKDFVYGFIQKLKHLPGDIRPSFFEFTTVMAFEYFAKKNVDFAIIEVGLGGRLDSTNIIRPMLCAITNVALDHQDILGDTVEKIAVEKAGIIKENTPVIFGDDDDSVRAIIEIAASQKNAKFVDAMRVSGQYDTDLRGNYQRKNVRTAVAAIEVLRELGVAVSDEDLKNGLLNVQKNTNFRGRWTVLSENPLTVCDTAHNLAGLSEVFAQLDSMIMRKHIILGFVKEKKIDEVLAILPRNSAFYFVKPYIARGRNPLEYEDLLKKSGVEYKIFEELQQAYSFVRQNITDGEMIFVGGSNFIVGEFLEKNLAE